MKTALLTVKQLRQELKAKVKIRHSRRYKIISQIYTVNVPFDKKVEDVIESPKPILLSRGGKMEMSVDFDDNRHFETVVLCSPKDNYNRRLAVKIGLGQIQHQISLSAI